MKRYARQDYLRAKRELPKIHAILLERELKRAREEAARVSVDPHIISFGDSLIQAPSRPRFEFRSMSRYDVIKVPSSHFTPLNIYAGRRKIFPSLR